MRTKFTKHWTEESTTAFALEIAAGFVRFVARSLDHSSQADIAKRLGVSEGSVSQMLNKPGNLTVKRIVEYARRALQAKVTIVTYDDGDPENINGPIQPEVFLECWHRCGKPKDFSDLKVQPQPAYLTYQEFMIRPYQIEAKAATDQTQRHRYEIRSGVTVVGTSGTFRSMLNA